MKCTNCGSDVPPGFRFCGNCGAKLAPRCPSCAAEVPEGFKFCGQCGASLQALGSSPAAAPPKPTTSAAPEAVLLQEELKQVTILFGDVSGFTAMSEKLHPEEVRLVMDACLKQLAKEVERFGGTVDKFSGDNIMALFGAPLAHEDDPERAVMAAIRMQEALSHFGADLEKRTGLLLQMRMGVNTGPVVAGITGSEQAKDYTVLGDAVNLASRLEQAAGKGKILVGESTHKATRAVIDYRELAPIMVKGKSQPVLIWEVVGPKARPEAKRGIRGLEAPLVGRDEELARLKDLFQRVVERKRPHLVSILGAPGVGKSRLSAEFEKDVAGLAPSTAVRKGQCVPYGSTTAFLPLAEAIKAECGILDSDSAAVAGEKLLAALQVSPQPPSGEPWAGRGEPAQVLETVSFALGLAPSGRFSEMDPKNVKEEIFWGLRKFLERRAAFHPLVLVFDDVHWADPSLLDFVEYLADRCEAVPLLILALSRPDLMDKRPTWGAYKKNYASIFLEPLDRGKSLQLIRQILKVEELPERLRGVIAGKAEGNPFYIEEILRMFIEDGVLFQETGVWRATADLLEGRIPDSIQALMAARIDRLPLEEKRVLQEASAVGRLFWEGSLLLLAADLSQEALRGSLRGLEVKELLAEQDDSQLAGEREWAFNHILVRDVTYESVPRARRAAKHIQVARWIEEKAADRLAAFVEMLAYHWEQAALVDLEMGALLGRAEASGATRGRAVHYLKLAGDKAKAMQSNLEANGFYNRAMTILGSLLQAGSETAEDVEDLRLSLLCSHAEVLEGLGEYDKAIQQLGTVREKAGERGLQGLEGDALRLLGSLYRNKGDLEEAERLARLALDCLAGEDQASVKGETLLLMGKVFHDLGQPGESLRWAEAALKQAEARGDRRLELATLPLLGTLSLHQGQLDQAEGLYQQAISLARDIGDKRVEGSTLYSLGNVDLNQGDLSASEEHLKEAIVAFQEMANRRGEAWSLLTLGTAVAREGDIAEGQRLVGQALRICQELGDKWGEPWCLRALGEFALAERDLVEAEKEYQEALAKTHSTGDQGILPELYRGLAEVALDRGQAAQSLEYADLAREAVSEDDTYSQGTTWRVRGMALAALGQGEEAEECLKRSIAVLEGTGFRPELARSYREYARYLEEVGRGEEAAVIGGKATGVV